jgi:hypothetical protein
MLLHIYRQVVPSAFESRQLADLLRLTPRSLGIKGYLTPFLSDIDTASGRVIISLTGAYPWRVAK